jgi:pimeloyl-ACP methyl ester carboxylesterase
MNDLEVVRRALGYGPIDLYGASYGATAAQIYLRLYPRSVRTLILDAGSLLSVPIFERLAPNAERALRLQLARCSADVVCRRAFPSTRSELATLLGRTARRAQVIRPAEIVTIDADAVARTVHALSLESDSVTQIPQIVHWAAQGDYGPLAQEYVDRVGIGLGSGAPLVMSFEILCSEPWARFDPERVRRSSAASYFGAAAESRAQLLARVCPFVPQGVVPTESEQLEPTAVPVLVLAGGADPQDPPANMRGWRSYFPNGRLVIVQGGTHGVLAEGCMPVLAARFIHRGTAQGLDTTCLKRIEERR